LIDSQSTRGADTVGQDSRGYDAGKKINGRKRFIVTDALGLLLCVLVLSAGVQDCDGAKPVLLGTYLRTRARFMFADDGCAGRLLDWATTMLRTTLQIVRKSADQRGFAVIPRRLAVERTVAWLAAHRRLARGLRTPRTLRNHDPLGRDQHHHPPDHPRRARDPAAEARLHTVNLIFSNTL
jgi:transposase